jgi:hypothetical protein
MGLGTSLGEPELSTLPERGTFYFALKMGKREILNRCSIAPAYETVNAL